MNRPVLRQPRRRPAAASTPALGGGGAPRATVAVVDADQAARGPPGHAARRRHRAPSARSTSCRPPSTAHPSVVRPRPVLRRPIELDRCRAAARPPAARSAPSWSPTSCRTELLQRALRAGVKDVLRPRSSRASSQTAVERVAARSAPAAGAGRPGRRGRPTPTGDARPGHHGVLHQGRGGQVGHRLEPGRRCWPSAATKPVVPGRRRPPVRRRRGDAQAGARSTPSSTRSARSTGSTPRCCESLLVDARALGPAGAARPARAGVRRPDRCRGDGAHRRDAAHLLPASWSSTRPPTSTTWCSGSSR